MATKITKDEYPTLNSEIGMILSSNQYAYMNIYTDANGETYATDSAGNQTCGRQVSSVSLTEPYLDLDTNAMTKFFTLIVFSDGATLISTDDVDNCWYTIYGVPVPPRRF